MHGHGRLGRLATALTATLLAGVPAATAAPAWASDQVTIDVLKTVDGAYVVQTVSVPAGTATAAADQLEQAPDVVAASPSVTYHTDAGSDPYWDTTDPQAVSAVRDVWPRTRGAGQIVAVLDTAVDTTHPDLAGAFVPGTDIAGDPGENWHGTGVSGVIAARADNGIGSAGMAPESKVMPIRVCNDSGCSSASIARGILWAADHGADVINMSLSGVGYSDVSAAAVQYALDKNISVVASAGNDGLNGNPVMYPAALSGVIGVSSTAPDGTPSDWSVHGWQVDMSTVGDSVLLTMPGGAYGSGSGTSFSGPAVAGAVALLRASHPGITPEDVQAALQAGVESTNWDRAWGAGRLDVPAAMDAADRLDDGVAVSPGSQTLDVSWNAVPGATNYGVRVDGVLRTTVTGTSTQLTGLTDGNQVAVDVQPSNGDRSAPVLATVGPAAPLTPTLVSASLRGTSTSAIIDLTATVPGAAAPKYAIIRDGVSIGSITMALSSTPTTTSIGIGAMPTTETHWQIRGVDNLGRTSGASNTVTAGSGRPAAPAGVTGLTAHLDGEQILLTWDDLGAAYSYRVSVGGSTVATPMTAGTVLPAPAVGQTRTYDVAAVDGWGQAGPSAATTVNRIAKPVMTVPPAVVGTLVVGQTVSTPDAFTGADSVTHIWRTCGTGGCAPVPGDVTHLIADDEAGERLEVEAVATNGGGDTSAVSAQSAYVTSPVPATPPGTPVIGLATAGDGSATVRWSPPASNGGAPITGYSVRTYRTGAAVQTTSVPADAASTVVTGLTNGTAHTFTVTAINSVGSSDESAASAPVTPAAPVLAPSAPVMGTAAPGNGTVRLAWSPPTSDGGGPILDYRVRVFRGMTELSTWTTAGTSLLVSGLANGAAHTFSVTARNSAGTGLAGTVVATPRTLPGAVRIGTPSAAPASAVVRWTPPTSNGGAPISSYSIRVYRGSALVKVVYAPGTATSTTVTGLLDGSAHSFIAAANNAAGAGPASARSASVVPRSRPSAPTIGWVLPGRGSMTVRWGPPYDGGSPVAAYVVRAYRGSTLVKSVSVVARTTLFTMGGLTRGAAYTFTVTAVNAVGWGAASVPRGPVATLR